MAKDKKSGAFQTSRCIFENPIWQNIVEFRLFFLIYGNATFIDGFKVGNVVLKRGQWIRSYRNLQADLEYIENRSVKKYSLSTIHRAVDNLLKQERIKVLPCELGTLFEVVNYAKYQGLDNYKSNIENAERTEKEQQENGNETAREQRQNNNKNVKNGKNVKNKDICAFEKFWTVYPKKRSKGQAEKAWDKIKPDEQLQNRITQSLEQAKTSDDWTKDGGKYIPYPATWLNAKGWEDEYNPQQQKSKRFNVRSKKENVWPEETPTKRTPEEEAKIAELLKKIKKE